MAQVADSAGNIIRALNFAGARLAADPATKALAPPVKAASKKLKTVVALRRDADDGTLDADALDDFAQQEVEEALVTLHFKFVAHFEAEDAEEVLAVFPKPPKSIINATTKDKALETYADLAKKAATRGSAQALKDPVKKFAAAVQAFAAAKKAVAAAEDAFEAAQEAEHKAKGEAIVALRKARAQLTDKFPDNLKRVARYFLKSKASAPGKVTPEPAPAPPVEG